ncbi:DMT family transporter [Paracoccus sp. Z118]|uniref:DMT family transporter n=1 Tax=Paracoccus sp. Z118 TaxID=2851017 RepID=UPI001C2B8F33|nr:DMT family transporter [Paracoccus sp. Z118]MBV0891033.1 DMT family transporter [Paracoccus sp. Z118]
MRTPIITPSRRLRPRSEPRARTQEGDNLLGAGLMMLSATATVSNDTAMKFVSQALPLSEAMFIRGLIIMTLLWLLARRDGGMVWWPERPRDRWLLALRSIGEVGATVLYLSALQHMEIGMLSAIMQSLPLLIMLAAAIVYGDRLGWRRMVAVAVGVAGVVMIVRPGTDAFDLWSLMGLGAVLFILLRDLVTRSLGREIRTSTIAFNAALGVTIAGVFLPSALPWRVPTTGEFGLLSLAAGLLMVGYISAVATMRVGEVGFVAPFRYTQLIVAGILGFIVFGERPDGWTLAGAALIVSAGLYSIWRETRLRKAP